MWGWTKVIGVSLVIMEKGQTIEMSSGLENLSFVFWDIRRFFRLRVALWMIIWWLVSTPWVWTSFHRTKYLFPTHIGWWSKRTRMTMSWTYLRTVWSIYYWFVTMGNAWSIYSSDLFPISRVQNIWGRTSLLHCKNCPKVHPLWYWCVLSLQVWWQRDTVQLWIHLFIWNWSRRMMTFSPDMGVRSGGDASTATRIASSLDLAQADLHGTGWTKESVGLLLTWSTPKHVYTGSYGKSFQIVFWKWSNWMPWHYWNYQEVATIGVINGWCAWLKVQNHISMTLTDVCMVWRHSLLIVIFLLRSHGGLYRGGSSLIYMRSVTENIIMGSVKVVKQGSLRPTPRRSSTSSWKRYVGMCLFGSRSRCQVEMTHAAIACMIDVPSRRQRYQLHTTMMKLQQISCGWWCFTRADLGSMLTLISQDIKLWEVNPSRLLRLLTHYVPPDEWSETGSDIADREYVVSKGLTRCASPNRGSETGSDVADQEYVNRSVRLPCRTTRRSLVLRNMISLISAKSSSNWERMADKVSSQPCTRSMTRPSTASLTLRSTSGMRLELVRSRRLQPATWGRCHRTGPRWRRSHYNSSSWNWSRTRRSSTPELKDSWTSVPPTWRPLYNWHLGTITKFLGFTHQSASMDWETCGSASRTSMCLTRSESMEHSRSRCYVITFVNSNFDLSEVTYEVLTSLSRRRTLGWAQQGRRTEFSIRLPLMRPSPSRSGRFIESPTISTWARPGSRHQPRTHSMRCSMSGNVKSSISGMYGDATTKRSMMREIW